MNSHLQIICDESPKASGAFTENHAETRTKTPGGQLYQNSFACALEIFRQLAPVVGSVTIFVAQGLVARGVSSDLGVL